MKKKREISLGQSDLVAIVADGAIAGRVAEGRLIPVLILDTSERPDVAEVIRVHGHSLSGEITFQWATSLDDEDLVIIVIHFIRPIQLQIGIPISIERQGILVEGMLGGRAVYLQAGIAGDRVSTTMDAPRVLAELPDTGFGEKWNEVVTGRMAQVFTRELGVPRREALALTEEFLTEMRKLSSLRFNPRQK